MANINTERFIKAFANRRRMAIVKYLDHHGKATVGEISGRINLSFRATSKHLGILLAADILEREQVGLMMFYALRQPLHPVTKALLAHF